MFRLAIGSYVEEYGNAIQVLKTRYTRGGGGSASTSGGGGPPGTNSTDSDAAVASGAPMTATANDAPYNSPDINNMVDDDMPETMEVYSACEIDHPYPCTKILWSPENRGSTTATMNSSSSNLGQKDLLATTGDYLRLWSVADDTNRSGYLTYNREAQLIDKNRKSDFCSPLTSFDWNEYDTSMIVTSSIDTTCTIWDINAEMVKTQVIAHDKEVFDLAFNSHGTDIFASVGADGSVRLFDLRNLEHTTIMFETPNLEPLLRLEWNKQDPNYLATFIVDSQYTIILDIRQPCRPVAMLGGHAGYVNAVAWAPHSSCHICTAADDKQALIWDISGMSKRPVEDPILAYNAEGEVNNLQWSAAQPDWVSIAFADKLQILRV
jgi:WD repeat-containing protein 68